MIKLNNLKLKGNFRRIFFYYPKLDLPKQIPFLRQDPIQKKSWAYRTLYEFLLKSGFTQRRAKTPSKELSIAHLALFFRER